MTDIDRLREALAPLRQQLLNHRLYGRLHSLEAMHVFMEHHVFAGWDVNGGQKTWRWAGEKRSAVLV